MTHLLALRSKNTHPELADQSVYYGGWGTYSIPFVPQEPIDEDEARTRRSYYVGHYDADGRLARFQKILDGAPDWTDEYVYWDNGKLRERTMIDPDGSRKVQQFDRKGRPADA